MRIATWLVAICLLLAFSTIVASALPDWADIERLWPMFGLGTFGAVIANSSGVGGGVVFVPAFNYFQENGVLALSAAQIIAASFLIQCFGMTTGTTRWLSKVHREGSAATGISLPDFFRMTSLVGALSVPAMLLTQFSGAADSPWVLWLFKCFSIALGALLLVTTLLSRRAPQSPRTQITRGDWLALSLLSIGGGIATAYFSVGVGELVALYLFVRNFSLATCAAVAVSVSALAVLCGSVYHLLYTDIPWTLLCFAIPGAVFGASLARPIALWLGAFRLKVVAGVWILASSSYLLLAALGNS